MNKYLYYENKIYDKIELLSKKYECSIQFVSNIPANACIINFENRYLIFVSNKLDKRLLPLTILHEFGHIRFKTIRNNPKKYNYFIELLSNLYAINKLIFMFPLPKKIILILLTFFREKSLYNYFIKNTKVGGSKIYEKLSKNK